MERVSALIINYMGYQETLRYVENLQAQQGIILSILVVDNGSPNESCSELARELRKYPNASLLQSGFNGGYAYGVNTGLKYLADKDADYILISNNDIRLDNDYLLQSLIREYCSLPGAAFIAPLMYVGGREDQKHQAWKIPRLRDDILASLRILYALGRFFGYSNRYSFPEGNQENQPVDCLSGSFFMGSKAVFCRLGLWDEQTFLYMEESILGWKIKRLGLQNYQARSLRFHHQLGGTTRALHDQARLQRYWLESAIYFQRTYGRAKSWQAWLLRVLYYCWVLETFIVNALNKKITH